MSLYRQVGRADARWIALAAVAGMLAGGAIGYGLRGGDEETSLREALAEVRDDVRPAIAGLELVTIEYPQAARGETESEYVGAEGSVQRARRTFEESRGDLAALDPVATRRAAVALERLDALVARRADAAVVVAQARAAAAALRAAAGG